MNNGKKLLSLLGRMGINTHSIKVNDCRYVFVEDTRSSIEKIANKALEKNGVVTWEDGSVQWIEYEPVADWSKTGSEVWLWKKNNHNMIACDKTLFTKKDGKVTKTVLKRIYRDYLKAMNGE